MNRYYIPCASCSQFGLDPPTFIFPFHPRDELEDLAATLCELRTSPRSRSSSPFGYGRGGGGEGGAASARRRLGGRGGARVPAVPLDAHEVTTRWGGSPTRRRGSPRRGSGGSGFSSPSRRAREARDVARARETLMLAEVLGSQRGPIAHDIADARRVLAREQERALRR